MVQHDFFVGPNARLLAAGQHSRQPRGRFGNALSVSALAHAIGGLCLLIVRLQAIVLPDGSIGNARVVRSLDDRFGLDEEAVKAVKQWRFEPGRREGRAVPVIVEIELSFALR
jgi:TonB family protein